MKPHHGTIIELSSKDCLNLLEKNTIAHLACHLKDEVYLVPITYSFQDGFIYSHSLPGQKIQMMRKNPGVCVQVQEVDDFFHWKSAIVWGKFEELHGEDAAKVMRSLVQKLASSNEHQSDLEVYFESLLNSAIIYRIKILRATGRSEGH